jgi:hypothetical protein
LRVARARKERLQKQIDLVNRRAKDAIAVEERLIGELEETKLIAFNSPSNLIGPLLSPST